jgi:tRNA/rRNA methyltransferase
LPSPFQFDRVSIVLVGTRNPLNVGAAARAMSNFGFSDLRLVTPFDPSFREAKSAVGASPLLARARVFASLTEAVADCDLVIGTTAAARRELQHPLKRLDDAAKIIRTHVVRGRVALLFGSEKRGLSNEDFSHCHWLLRIPTREEHGSMNLGQAVAVCLYEIARLQQPGRGSGKPGVLAKKEKDRLANGVELERITAILLDVLRASGYLPATSSSAAADKVRRMVRRMNLSTSDAEVWLGMLRQVLWKTKKIG